MQKHLQNFEERRKFLQQELQNEVHRGVQYANLDIMIEFEKELEVTNFAIKVLNANKTAEEKINAIDMKLEMIQERLEELDEDLKDLQGNLQNTSLSLAYKMQDLKFKHISLKVEQNVLTTLRNVLDK